MAVSAIVAQIPVRSHLFLMSADLQLADKKLSGVALSKLEEERHNQLLKDAATYQQFYEEKSGRILGLNGVAIYDLTKAGFVSVENQEANASTLLIDQLPVAIPKTAAIAKLIFNGLSYVVVRDNPLKGHLTLELKTAASSAAAPQILFINTRLRVKTKVESKTEMDAQKNCVTVPEYWRESYFAYDQSLNSVRPLPKVLLEELPVPREMEGELLGLMNEILSGAAIAPALIDQHTQALASHAAYKANFKAKLARIHMFEDQTVRLLDFTAKGLATVIYTKKLQEEFICLQERKVQIPTVCYINPSISSTPFSSKEPWNTDYVLVRDVPDQPWVMIERVEKLRDGHIRPLVQTYYVHLDESSCVDLGPFPEKQFLAEKAFPIQPWAPASSSPSSSIQPVKKSQ